MEKIQKKEFEIRVGQFQENLIETNIVELLLKKYGTSKMLYSILSKYCECNKMIPSKVFFLCKEFD